MSVEHRTEDVQNGMVAQLERLLEDARSGAICGLAIAAAFPDGATGSFFLWNQNPNSLIGAVTVMQQEVVLASLDTGKGAH